MQTNRTPIEDKAPGLLAEGTADTESMPWEREENCLLCDPDTGRVRNVWLSAFDLAVRELLGMGE